MSIGILTWKLHNFGTALQAYALVNAVAEMSENQCKLLNYSLPRKECIVQVAPLTVKEFMRKIENRFILQKKDKRNIQVKQRYKEQIAEQHLRFRKFYEQIPHDNHEVSIKEKEYFDYTYEKVIVGSDQVWNPKYFCETYFLNFVSDEKKYSYAPSIGVDNLKEAEREYLRLKLKGHFQNISVREKTGKELLENILPNEKVDNVLDPTLLFNGSWWEKSFKLSEKRDKDKYMLVYTLSDNLWYKDAISKIQKELNVKKIVYITPEDNLYFYDESENVVVNAGPIEFLTLVKNAECVITDSFHGVCFSLNFEKTFWCLSRFNSRKKNIRNENSRVYDLLSSLKIENRFCKENFKIQVDTMDYGRINFDLNELRKQSQEYLKEIIKN